MNGFEPKTNENGEKIFNSSVFQNNNGTLQAWLKEKTKGDSIGKKNQHEFNKKNRLKPTIAHTRRKIHRIVGSPPKRTNARDK